MIEIDCKCLNQVPDQTLLVVKHYHTAYFSQVKDYNNAIGISKTMSLNTPYFGDFTIDD